MLGVVESGTGHEARVAGVKVAGKTGTAEVSKTNLTTTFIGFAPYDTPTMAIAVTVENYDTHKVTAAKIASGVIQATLAAQGQQ